MLGRAASEDAFLTPEQQNAYPKRFNAVTGALNTDQLKKINIQSLITPAMFMVRADVLPIKRKTACECRLQPGSGMKFVLRDT